MLNENTAKGLLIKPYVTNRHLHRTNFIVLYVQCSREDIPLAYNTCVAESMTMGEVVKVKTDRKWVNLPVELVKSVPVLMPDDR